MLGYSSSGKPAQVRRKKDDKGKDDKKKKKREKGHRSERGSPRPDTQSSLFKAYNRRPTERRVDAETGQGGVLELLEWAAGSFAWLVCSDIGRRGLRRYFDRVDAALTRDGEYPSRYAPNDPTGQNRRRQQIDADVTWLQRLFMIGIHPRYVMNVYDGTVSHEERASTLAYGGGYIRDAPIPWDSDSNSPNSVGAVLLQTCTMALMQEVCHLIYIPGWIEWG
jgi:hypothetical protein